MRVFLFFISFILFTSQLSIAQNQSRQFIHGGVSTNAYTGDLSNSFEKWTAAFHVGVKFNKKKRVNGSLNLHFGSITGQNSSYEFRDIQGHLTSPNLFFKTNFISGNYDFQVNILRKESFTLYISQGIGIIRFDPEDQFSESLEDQFNTRSPNESFQTTSIMFPTQIGGTYYLPNGFGFDLKGGFLNTVTDYLDNIADWGSKSGNDNILSVRYRYWFLSI